MGSRRPATLKKRLHVVDNRNIVEVGVDVSTGVAPTEPALILVDDDAEGADDVAEPVLKVKGKKEGGQRQVNSCNECRRCVIIRTSNT